MSEVVHNINPGDSDWTKHRYILAFGAHHETRVLVHANSLDHALDEAGDFLAEKFPGCLADIQVQEAFDEAREAGLSHDESWERALVDVTAAGNDGHYLLSWEWGINAEDPTDEYLATLQLEPPTAEKKEEDEND